MHVAQNSQLLLKTLEMAIYFPRKIYKYDPMGFWVGSTGKFSSGAGQITLQRLAHFFFFVSESSPNKLRHIWPKKKNGPKMSGASSWEVVEERFQADVFILISFLELTVSFDFELSS